MAEAAWRALLPHTADVHSHHAHNEVDDGVDDAEAHLMHQVHHHTSMRGSLTGRGGVLGDPTTSSIMNLSAPATASASNSLAAAGAMTAPTLSAANSLLHRPPSMLELSLQKVLQLLTDSPHRTLSVAELEGAKSLCSRIDNAINSLAASAAVAAEKRKVKKRRSMEVPMLAWEEELQLPPDQVDAKLWAGASAQGWRVIPRHRHAAEKSTWAYLAPSGVRLTSKAAAHAAASDNGASALVARSSEARERAIELGRTDAALMALRQAEEEGLTLVRSSASQTGYMCVVYRPQNRMPFAVWLRVHGPGGGSRKLGIFGTAEEAALAYARYLGVEGSAAEAKKQRKRERKREGVIDSDDEGELAPSAADDLDDPNAPGRKRRYRCKACGAPKRGHKNCPAGGGLAPLMPTIGGAPSAVDIENDIVSVAGVPRPPLHMGSGGMTGKQSPGRKRTKTNAPAPTGFDPAGGVGALNLPHSLGAAAPASSLPITTAISAGNVISASPLQTATAMSTGGGSSGDSFANSACPLFSSAPVDAAPSLDAAAPAAAGDAAAPAGVRGSGVFANARPLNMCLGGSHTNATPVAPGGMPLLIRSAAASTILSRAAFPGMHMMPNTPYRFPSAPMYRQ